jgi:methionyl-tRNA formyltransferase
MKIQILTSKQSWLYQNREKIGEGNKIWKEAKIITDHRIISNKFDAVFILSYYKIIPQSYLKINKYNLVIHESNLPKGRGFSPLYRQIVEGRTKITFTLFECSKKMDEGKVYLKKIFNFPKNITYKEIKTRQLKYAKILIEIFSKKLKENKLMPKKQIGKPSYFKKFTSKDSEINIKKSLLSQFDKIRIKDNEKFPGYFFYKKRKFILKLFVFDK